VVVAAGVEAAGVEAAGMVALGEEAATTFEPVGALEVAPVEAEAEAPEVVVGLVAMVAGPAAAVDADGCVGAWAAITTPIPTTATVAVTPIATVARRIRTSASSRDRAAPACRGCGRGGGTMVLPFVDGHGSRWRPVRSDEAIPTDPPQSHLHST
jgi:hypothetical protein